MDDLADLFTAAPMSDNPAGQGYSQPYGSAGGQKSSTSAILSLYQSGQGVPASQTPPRQQSPGGVFVR